MSKMLKRTVAKSVKFTPNEWARIESKIPANEDFSKYCRRTLLRVRPPRKFDLIQNQITILSDEILVKIGNEKIDLEVLKMLQDLKNIIKDL